MKLRGLHRWLCGKEPACQCRRHKRLGFDPCVRKIPWGRKRQPKLEYSCLEKSYRQRSLADYSLWGRKELDTTEWLSTHSEVKELGETTLVTLGLLGRVFIPLELPDWGVFPDGRASHTMWLSWVRGILQGGLEDVLPLLDSLWPRGLQHARPPCPSPTPGACSNSCPSSQWCHPTISSSVVPFSSCPQFFPASGSFPVSQFFASGGQSTGASVSASVLSISIQEWFPLGLTVKTCSEKTHLFSGPHCHLLV